MPQSSLLIENSSLARSIQRRFPGQLLKKEGAQAQRAAGIAKFAQSRSRRSAFDVSVRRALEHLRSAPPFAHCTPGPSVRTGFFYPLRIPSPRRRKRKPEFLSSATGVHRFCTIAFTELLGVTSRSPYCRCAAFDCHAANQQCRDCTHGDLFH